MSYERNITYTISFSKLNSFGIQAYGIYLRLILSASETMSPIGMLLKLGTGNQELEFGNEFTAVIRIAGQSSNSLKFILILFHPLTRQQVNHLLFNN